MKKILGLLLIICFIFLLTGCKCQHENIIVDDGIKPTCSMDGLTQGSHCADCGVVIVKQKKIDKLEHTVEIDEAVQPTCLKDGLSEGQHCSICQTVFVEQQVIKALGHSIVIDEAKKATCEESGLTEGKHCQTCGEILVSQSVIEKLGHTIIKQQAVTATREATGLTEGEYCSVCKKVLKAQQIVPILTQHEINFVADSEKGILVGETTQTIYPDETTSEVVAIANLGYKFVKWSNGSTERRLTLSSDTNLELEAIFEVDNNSIPLITITTEDNQVINSKETWIKCTISTSLCQDEYVETELSAKIKGRGNSTWKEPKKPYKFKLDSKADLFGLGKAKNWVLLANYDDPSGIRSSLAYTSGKQLESIADSTTDTMMVEVILNGEYIGIYNLTEQIEVNKNRVDIMKDSSEADTGYIIELDGRAPQEGVLDVDYFKVEGINYAVKDPDPDDELNAAQMTFIKNYVTDAYTALSSGDYSLVTSLIDVDTFASCYIVQELVKSVDVGWLSFFMYKDAGGKLCNGPIWDYHISCGNCNYNDHCVLTNYLYAKENPWYSKLLEYEEFEQLVAQKLDEAYEDLYNNINDVVEDAYAHADSYYRNFNRWQTIGIHAGQTPQVIIDIKTWEGNVTFVKDWIYESLAYLRSVYRVEK